MTDLRKGWLRSRWMLLAIALEVTAVAYAHLDELRAVLPADFYQWLAFLLPVLLALLRCRAAGQAPLAISPAPRPRRSRP